MVNFINFSNFQTLQTTKRVALWFIASLAVSLIFFQEFWASLGTMLSPDWIFGQHHAAPWGVLGLCGIWLWLKRKEIWKEMLEGGQVTRLKGWRGGNFINFMNLQTFKLVAGLAIVAVAILMPSPRDFLVFQVLLASLGLFVIFFGTAVKIPSILLGIYGFAISFPLMVDRFAGIPYSMTAVKPLMWILTGLGYPLQNQGQLVNFTSSSGEPISVVIAAGCAGPATMGVFLAIFALMMLDIPLRPRKAVWIFVFGAVGTWLQSFIRLIILMLVGYYWGREALFTAHSWTIYALFPLWYLFFGYIYFRQAGSLRRIAEKVAVPIGRTINASKSKAAMKDKIKKAAQIAVILILAVVLFYSVGRVNAQVPTWGSYSDLEHATPSDSFTELGCTVFMWGDDFVKNTWFEIVYWDGTGYKRVVDRQKSLGNNELSSEHTFGGSDVAGDWHCTVYTDTLTPESYVPGGPGVVADDISYTAAEPDASFHVAESAIPEFSTVISAIGVAGLCFGIYYWMRRRRLASGKVTG